MNTDGTDRSMDSEAPKPIVHAQKKVSSTPAGFEGLNSAVCF
jgi:hypothetical protein